MPDFPELTADLIRRLRDPEQSLTRSDIYWITNTAADRLSALQERNAELTSALDEIHGWLVCAAIASADDMAQSFPHMEEVARAALSQEPTRQGEG